MTDCGVGDSRFGFIDSGIILGIQLDWNSCWDCFRNLVFNEWNTLKISLDGPFYGLWVGNNLSCRGSFLRIGSFLAWVLSVFGAVSLRFINLAFGLATNCVVEVAS